MILLDISLMWSQMMVFSIITIYLSNTINDMQKTWNVIKCFINLNSAHIYHTTFMYNRSAISDGNDTTYHDDVIKWKHFPRYFPAQRPVTRSFDVFFDLRLNKRLSEAGDLRRYRIHYGVTVMLKYFSIPYTYTSKSPWAIKGLFLIDDGLWKNIGKILFLNQ